MGNCDGKFLGNAPYASCTNFFQGCECEQSAKTCGPPQDCSMNGCAGEFDLSNGLAYCSGNFKGCQCQPNAATCGRPQACEQDNCKGGFNGNQPYPVCKGFFAGCTCSATDATCGNPQPCDRNGCAGAYDSSGVARCQGNFKGCKCTAVSVSAEPRTLPTSYHCFLLTMRSIQSTCGNPQNCDLNGCNGAFTGASSPATCQGKFAGCPCIPVKVWRQSKQAIWRPSNSVLCQDHDGPLTHLRRQRAVKFKVAKQAAVREASTPKATRSASTTTKAALVSQTLFGYPRPRGPLSPSRLRRQWPPRHRRYRHVTKIAMCHDVKSYRSSACVQTLIQTKQRVCSDVVSGDAPPPLPLTVTDQFRRLQKRPLRIL